MNKYNYCIYQLSKDVNLSKKYRNLPDNINVVNLSEDKYKIVYENSINGKNTEEVLEKLFHIFNIEHPKDFEGHSLSVSDIVRLNNTFYYCQSLGWKEINIVK